MKKCEPYISVIIPVFNRIKYVEEAINSALIQPEVAEVIVIDDGSKDGSLELCVKLKEKNPRIKVYAHKRNKNKGIAASRNLGIRKASCKWIAFLDSDDYYLPDRFKTASKLIKDDEKIDGVYSVSQQFIEDTNELKECGGIKKQIKPEELFTTLIEFNYGSFDTPSILLRKDLILKVGSFEERIKTCEDTQMWFKAALVGKFIEDFNKNPLVKVRIHNENIWNGQSEKYIFFHGHYLMFLYGIQFVLKNANFSQQKVYFDQILKDYRIYYRLLPNQYKFKWFCDIYPKIFLLTLNKLVVKNHVEFSIELKKWCIQIIKVETINKINELKYNILRIVPRRMKDRFRQLKSKRIN